MAAIIILLLSSSVALALDWTNAHTSNTAEAQVSGLIQAEHLRVCGTSIGISYQLRDAARYKAQDMGYRNRMTHAFVDGKYIWDFYGFAGIARTYGSGEIIAWNNYPDDQSPTVAFNGWMGSSTHRAIIQSCAYDNFGVGAFQTKGGGTEGGKWYAAEFTNTR